jgi:hypothetical protein
MTESIGKIRRVRKTDRGQAGAPAPTVIIPAEALPIAPDYPLRSRDKVAIVGFADGHRALAPFDDPTFEVWGLNRLWSALPGKRFDRWFEIHSIPGLYLEGEDHPADKDHLAFLAKFAGPIYIRPQDMGTIPCPSAQPYALNAVLRDFAVPPDRHCFSNSISYMIAYAIAMRFKEIHVFGVDMAQDQLLSAEYRQQRPSCEFFLGIAVGRGIQIYLPPGSDLLISDHLYGFEDGSPIMLKRLARLQELGKRKEGVKQQLAQLEAQKASMEQQYWAQKISLVAAINQQDGAQQQIQYDMVNLTTPPEHSPPAHIG